MNTQTMNTIVKRDALRLGRPGQHLGVSAVREPADAPSLAALDRRARALGWFSVGLGLAEVLLPEALSGAVGAPTDAFTRGRARKVAGVRALGAREITAGLGILSGRGRTGWLWARVLGDFMDLAVLAGALGSSSRRNDRTKLALATAAVAGITVLDAVTARQLGAATRQNGSGTSGGTAPQPARSVRVQRSITVNRPPSEVYRFWRDLENLPRFMAHLESVTTDGARSRWSAKGPAGTTAHWEATLTADVPNERIAWRSVEGSEIANEGTVRFARAPGGQGTEVHVDLQYDPPAGHLGALIAKLFGEEPSEQIKGDLYRFKQVMETGEVLHSDASIHRGPHPARPSAPATTTPGTAARTAKGEPR